MAYFSRVGVHKDGFQVAHEQRVHVQLLAQAVHGNEVEMGIESARSKTVTGFRLAKQLLTPTGTASMVESNEVQSARSS